MSEVTDKILLNAGPSARGWHFYERFIRCPRLFALARVPGALGPPSEPLVRGSLGHIGVAHHFARMKARQDAPVTTANLDPADRYYLPAEAIDLLAVEFGARGEELRPIAQQTVLEYLSLYADEGWKILHVEEEFALRFRDQIDDRERSVRYTMRPDLIVADSSDRKWIIDHKFVTKIGHLADRYTLSGQFLGLALLGRQLYGADFGGCVVNAIQCAPRFKVVKVPLEPAPASLARFPKMILDVNDAITRLEAEGREPMDWPGANTEFMCINTYSKCEAFDICRFGV